MSQYKHISFDFWNTLATPNPEFATQRNKVLSRFADIQPELASIIYSQTKKELDNIAETYGHGMSTRICVLQFLRNLTNSIGGRDIDSAVWDRVNCAVDAIQKTALDYPPIISEDTKEMLYMLRAKYSLSITSNTNFINGATLRKVVDPEGDIFKFFIFSDEEQIAKPSPDIFFKLIKQSGCRPSEILHIGDSQACDINGAQRLDIGHLLINNPDNLVTHSYINTLIYA